MKTLLLIDGNAIMHRAFHAIPPFQTKKGIPTNVVYGFLTMLLKSVHEFSPDSIIVCFDTPKPTFRNELYAKYQEHRPKIDDSFIQQIPLVKDVLDKAGILRLEKDGYEADDVIGTMVEHFKKNTKILILTGDKDIFQLIDQNVYVVAPKFGFNATILYDRQAVIDKLGIPPDKISDWKALAGDPSDNYKGADGIGQKTAAKLILEHGTVEDLLKKIDTLPEGKIKESIRSHTDDIIMCKKLARIKCDVPVEMDPEKAHFETIARPELKKILEELEMNTLVERIFAFQKTPVKKTPPQKEKKDADFVQSKLF